MGAGRRFGSGMARPARVRISGWQVGTVFQMYSGEPLGFGDVIFNGDIQNIPLAGSEQTSEATWPRYVQFGFKVDY